MRRGVATVALALAAEGVNPFMLPGIKVTTTPTDRGARG